MLMFQSLVAALVLS